MTEELKTTPSKEEAVTTEAVTTDTATVAPAAAPKKRKLKRSVPYGQVHVYASFNNTIISFTDAQGGALTASSSGA